MFCLAACGRHEKSVFALRASEFNVAHVGRPDQSAPEIAPGGKEILSLRSWPASTRAGHISRGHKCHRYALTSLRKNIRPSPPLARQLEWSFMHFGLLLDFVCLRCCFGSQALFLQPSFVYTSRSQKYFGILVFWIKSISLCRSLVVQFLVALTWPCVDHK